MRIFILLFLLSLNQITFAEHIYEVDAAKCNNATLNTGDTLRFVNSSKRTIYVNAKLFHYGIPPGEYADYKVYNNFSSQFLLRDQSVNYACRFSDLEEDFIANASILTFRPKPIDISPKQHLLSIAEPFTIGIYLRADDYNDYASTIKQIVITVDGTVFFKGNTNDYKNLIKKQNTYRLKYVFIDGTYAPPLTFLGYSVTRFNIAAGTFQQGSHVIRAKITLETPEGNVDYEEKSEVFVSS